MRNRIIIGFNPGTYRVIYHCQIKRPTSEILRPTVLLTVFQELGKLLCHCPTHIQASSAPCTPPHRPHVGGYEPCSTKMYLGEPKEQCVKSNRYLIYLHGITSCSYPALVLARQSSGARKRGTKNSVVKAENGMLALLHKYSSSVMCMLCM